MTRAELEALRDRLAKAEAKDIGKWRAYSHGNDAVVERLERIVDLLWLIACEQAAAREALEEKAAPTAAESRPISCRVSTSNKCLYPNCNCTWEEKADG